MSRFQSMYRNKQIQLVANALNEAKVTWAVGASMMLYFHGNDKLPNDMDLMVSFKDFDKAFKALESIGQGEIVNDNHQQFKTQRFAKFEVDGLEVDLIAGFNILQPTTLYEYDFDEEAVDFVFETEEGASIPVSKLEDWYILYALMGREHKVDTVERMLSDKATFDMERISRLSETVDDVAFRKRANNLIE